MSNLIISVNYFTICIVIYNNELNDLKFTFYLSSSAYLELIKENLYFYDSLIEKKDFIFYILISLFYVLLDLLC